MSAAGLGALLGGLAVVGGAAAVAARPRPVWAHGIDLERAYPRGPMNFEHATARFTLDAESKERLRTAFASVRASEVTRHGSVSPEELRAAPKPWWER